MKNYIKDIFLESINLKNKILNDDKILIIIENIINECINCYKNNGKLLIAGNGGSSSDSQHITAEFVSKFNYDRSPLPAISLNANTSIITAIGNDYGYKYIFSRQLKALANKNDIFLGITTSGNSENIIEAVKTCKELNIKSIIFNGKNGGTITSLNPDFNIIIPSNYTPRIQEIHIIIGHIICDFIEKEIFPK